MTELLLVRHGQAQFASADYDQLSPLGVRQAARLGQRWRASGLAPGALVSGSLQRHRQSAAACLAALGAATDWTSDPGFDEYDHLALLRAHDAALTDMPALHRHLAQWPEGERAPAFQRLFTAAVARWTDGAHDADYAEPWPAFQQRCQAAARRAVALARARGAARATVFTSGGPIAALVQQALGLPTPTALALSWTLHNAGLTRFAAGRQGLRLIGLNDTAHLETADAGLLTHR